MKPHDCTIRRSATSSSALRQLLLWTMAACLMALSFSSSAGIALSVNIAPPALPVYAQPMMPGPGYLWTPGYWDYGDGDYFWVPGTWVLPPFVGALWTPGYWGWNNGLYAFNTGYWGTSVGFYGGIDYGYGYSGRGYSGGRWDHGAFSYNRAANRIDPRYARNVYNSPIGRNGNRVSYNGGHGGVMARPTAGDQRIANQRRVQPVAAQQQQVRMASQNRTLRASVNHGAPSIAATQRAGAFSGNGVVRANSSAAARGRTPAAANRGHRSTQTAAHTPRSNAPAQFNAQRSARFAPQNRGNQNRGAPAQYSHAGAHGQPARSGHEGAMRQGMARPESHSSQQPHARAPQRPARSEGNRGGEGRERH